MLSYTTVYFAAVGIIALLMIILIVHEIGKRAGVKMERDRLMSYTSKLVDDNETLKTNNDYLRAKLEEKEQNVSRETSYNKSYGDPEITRWIDQRYAKEDHE